MAGGREGDGFVTRGKIRVEVSLSRGYSMNALWMGDVVDIERERKGHVRNPLLIYEITARTI